MAKLKEVKVLEVKNLKTGEVLSMPVEQHPCKHMVGVMALERLNMRGFAKLIAKGYIQTAGVGSWRNLCKATFGFDDNDFGNIGILESAEQWAEWQMTLGGEQWGPFIKAGKEAVAVTEVPQVAEIPQAVEVQQVPEAPQCVPSALANHTPIAPIAQPVQPTKEDKINQKYIEAIKKALSNNEEEIVIATLSSQYGKVKANELVKLAKESIKKVEVAVPIAPVIQQVPMAQVPQALPQAPVMQMPQAPVQNVPMAQVPAMPQIQVLVPQAQAPIAQAPLPTYEQVMRTM